MKTAIRSLELFTGIPAHARIFLVRSLLLFALWRSAYLFILMPLEIPDAWLVRTLGDATAGLLNLFSDTEHFHVVHARRFSEGGSGEWETHSVLFRTGNRPVLGLYQPCNGLELMVLSAGFILCLQGSRKRKIGFILAGTAGIFILNVIRCILLAAISIRYPVHFEFAHKYLFNFVAYAFVFLLWNRYLAGQKVASDGDSDGRGNCRQPIPATA